MSDPIERARAKVAQYRAHSPAVVLVLVEGPSDCALWKTHLNAQAARAVPLAGRGEVEACLAQRPDEAIIGIVDDDYDTLRGRTPVQPPCFATDAHDLECLLLRCGGLERLLECHANPAKRAAWEAAGRSVAQTLLDLGGHFGQLRLYFVVAGLHLQEWLKPAAYVDPATWTLDTDALHDAVTAQCGPLPSLPGANADPWFLANGHDLVALLRLALRAALGDKPITESAIRGLLIQAPHLPESALYEALVGWSAGTGRPLFA